MAGLAKTSRESAWPVASKNEFWFGEDGRLGIQHFRTSYQLHFPEHTHSEYNIVICVSGRIRVNQLGTSETLGPGDITLGNSGVAHSSEYAVDGEPTEAVSLTFSHRLLLQRLGETGLVRWRERVRPAFVGQRHDEQLLDLAVGVTKEMVSRSGGYGTLLNALASQMLIHTMRSWVRGVEKGAECVMPQLPRWQFVKAVEHMTSRSKDQFNVALLARELGSSEVRLNRLFRESTGTTPACYYNRALLSRAASLLRGSNLSVKEIAFDLGFRTPSHFCEWFRRLGGNSPWTVRSQKALIQPAAGSDNG